MTTADELLAQPSPSKPGKTLKDVKDDMFNRIREVFNIGRMKRIEGSTGGYSHNSGTVSGVLVGVEGGHDAAAKDVSMHVAAMHPLAVVKEEIDPALVAQEREISRGGSKEGKPATSSTRWWKAGSRTSTPRRSCTSSRSSRKTRDRRPCRRAQDEDQAVRTGCLEGIANGRPRARA